MSRTIVVGDVHGCVRELEDLLAKVSFSARDRLVLVGDIVAKGPDSKGVVTLARKLGALAVRGNHDEQVLRIHRGRARTVKPHHKVVVDSLDNDDWRWLSRLPLWMRLGKNHLVVHGGIVPGIPLRAQDPALLMNLRSIKPSGAPSTKLDGTPWAASWKGPRTVIFGHDAVRGLQRYPHAIGLDTGCVYGNELTAWIIEEERFVSVKAHRAYAVSGATQQPRR